MKTAITIHELRTMSAETIRAFKGAIVVKDGAEMIAILIPVRSAKETVRKILARIDAAAAKRTPEQTSALEKMLGECDSERSTWE